MPLYEWELLQTETGCRLIVSRMRLATFLLGTIALPTGLTFAYALWKNETVLLPFNPVAYATIVLVAACSLVWCYFRPSTDVFVADFNINTQGASLWWAGFYKAYARDCPFKTIKSIDTIVTPRYWSRRTIPPERVCALRITFTDGTILKPPGRENDPTGKIRFFTSGLRDLTGIPGEEIQPKGLFG